MSPGISRTLTLCTVLAIAGSASPRPTVAQQPTSERGAARAHEVGLYVGGLYTQDELPLNAGLDTGFRYAYRISDNIRLGVETGLTLTDEAENEGLLGHAQLQARWHPFGATRRVDPFLLVGAGAAGYNTLGTSESSPVLVFGLGVELNWLNEVGFRLDAADFWLTDMLGESSHNFRVNWGPIFRF
ncbi:MAG: hypothetical protein PVG79_12775 [Gemmatimonadales bacterium]|jgi:hypothetical protein